MAGRRDRPAAGQLGHDHGGDPAPDVNGAGIFLDDARLSAAALSGDLSQAQELLAAINGEPAHGRHALPGRLVPRASTAVYPVL